MRLDKKDTIFVVFLLIAGAVALITGVWIQGAILLLGAGAVVLGETIIRKGAKPKEEERIIPKEPEPQAEPKPEVVKEVMPKPVVKPEPKLEPRPNLPHPPITLPYVPNGFVILGPKNSPVLIDFDEAGIAAQGGTEVSIGNWVKDVTDKTFPNDMLVLVHSVKGSKDCLLMSLRVTYLVHEGQRTTVAQVARKGLLNTIAEKIRKDYIEEMPKEKTSDMPKR